MRSEQRNLSTSPLEHYLFILSRSTRHLILGLIKRWKISTISIIILLTLSLNIIRIRVIWRWLLGLLIRTRWIKYSISCWLRTHVSCFRIFTENNMVHLMRLIYIFEMNELLILKHADILVCYCIVLGCIPLVFFIANGVTTGHIFLGLSYFLIFVLVRRLLTCCYYLFYIFKSHWFSLGHLWCLIIKLLLIFYFKRFLLLLFHFLIKL